MRLVDVRDPRTGDWFFLFRVSVVSHSFRLSINKSLSFRELSFSPGFYRNCRYSDSDPKKYLNFTLSLTTNQIPIRTFFMVGLSPFYHISWLAPTPLSNRTLEPDLGTGSWLVSDFIFELCPRTGP